MVGSEQYSYEMPSWIRMYIHTKCSLPVPKVNNAVDIHLNTSFPQGLYNQTSIQIHTSLEISRCLDGTVDHSFIYKIDKLLLCHHLPI